MSETEQEAADALTPLPAIRKYCLWCVNGSWKEVELCPAKRCPLWTYRFGHRPDEETLAAMAMETRHVYPRETNETWTDLKGAPPLQMIRRKCLDCSGGSADQVRNCQFTPEVKVNPCSLWPLRFGKPANKRQYTNEQRAAMAARARLLPKRMSDTD